MLIVEVHISTIRPGDTVEHLGHQRTVGRKDIKDDLFFGAMMFGDSYNLGRILVKKVIFPKWYKGQKVILP